MIYEIKKNVDKGLVTLELFWDEPNLALAQELANRIPLALERALYLAGHSKKFVDSVITSLKISVSPHGVVASVKHPIFPLLEAGTKPRTMKELLGKVVPLKTPQGVIFRKVTEKGLLLGKWRHPGIPARKFLERATLESLSEAIGQVRMEGEEVVWKVSQALLRLIRSTKG